MISKIISTNPAIMADEIQRLKEGLKNSVSALRSLTAKNLNSLPYYRNSGYSTHDITFTYGSDGKVIANGISSDTATFACHSRNVGSANSLILPNGFYKLTGGVSEECYVFANNTKNGTNHSLGNDFGSGVTIHLDGSDSVPEGYSQIAIYCVVAKGVTVSNFTFKPMLELVSLDNPGEYQEYSKTNDQLTKDVNKLLCTQTTAGSYYLTTTVDSEGAITYSWEVIE